MIRSLRRHLEQFLQEMSLLFQSKLIEHSSKWQLEQHFLAYARDLLVGPVLFALLYQAAPDLPFLLGLCIAGLLLLFSLAQGTPES